MEGQLFWWLGVFAVALFILIKAANIFTKAAEQVGLHFRLPPFIMGVTIVSLGTTIPELASSVLAVLQGAPALVAGNVVGSNIANIFVVLGVAALAAPFFRASWDLVKHELPLLGGAVIIATLALLDGTVTRLEGLILLAGYLMYVIAIMALRRNFQRHFSRPALLPKRFTINWPKTAAALAIAPVFIYLGANYTVEALINLAQLFNVGKGIIGATILALGTSLPELTIAIQSALQGKPEISAGNVLGANIMNSLFILGAPALISALPVTPAIVNAGLPFMILATIVYVLLIRDQRISKADGVIMLTLYGAFVVALMMAGRS